MRDMRLFEITDLEDSENYDVSAIHNDKGYKSVRKSLSEFYNRSRYVPDIQVYSVDVSGNRSLSLLYTSIDDKDLDINELDKVLPHIKFLWGFPVRVVQRESGKNSTISLID